MTYEMALLASEMNGEQCGLKRGFTEGTEAVAIKLIRMGLKFADIQKATGLPMERIQQLANENTVDMGFGYE